MSLPASFRRRSLIGLMAASCLPAVHAASGRTFVIQTEPSLQQGTTIVAAALKAAGYPATLVSAPRTTELRNLHESLAGRIHITLLPPTVTRLSMVKEGRMRLIPIPLERGLLGWRVPFLIREQRDLTANVHSLSDLRSLIVGQGSSWIDAEIYRKAGLITREVQEWRNGEFAAQMRSGVINLFPMGLEESLNYFLPHFQRHEPDIILDQHLLLRYPWYRFVWVTAHPNADGLYQALQDGFDTIVSNGQFESIWNKYRQVPAESDWRGRQVIDLLNPYYTRDIVPTRYRHLLLDRSNV